MQLTKLNQNNINVALFEGETIIINNVQSALDLIVQAKYEADSSCVIIKKELIIEDFFDLSTKLAGEILQKFVNYGCKISIVGNFSNYNSKALKDFIYESNKGKNIFFVESVSDALNKLCC